MVLCFLVALWLVVSIATPIIVFCVTKSPFSFTGFAGLIVPWRVLNRLLQFVFPLNNDEIDLERERIRSKRKANDVKMTTERHVHMRMSRKLLSKRRQMLP